MKIVMGPACSGKSTFIKSTFPNYTVIDLYEYQYGNKSRYATKDFLSIEDLYQTYIDTRDALVEELKENKNVVLEHTLLLQKRRPMYIDAIRSILDDPIDIYVMKPKKELYEKFCKERNIEPNYSEFEFMEIPTKEEGFRNIYVVEVL